MALSNFLITAVGVGAALLLLRGDVRQTAATFRRNVRHIRVWLEEEEKATKALKDSAKQLGGAASSPETKVPDGTVEPPKEVKGP